MSITYLDVTCAESGLEPAFLQMSSMEMYVYINIYLISYGNVTHRKSSYIDHYRSTCCGMTKQERRLVDESVRNVMNTPHKFFILGDFNTDFLKNPSTHLLDILLTIKQPATISHLPHSHNRDIILYVYGSYYYTQ